MDCKIVLLVLAVSGCAVSQAGIAPQQSRELAQRAAGVAQRCVLIEPGESLRVSDSDGHLLLYGSGRTIWANSLGPGCGFDSSDVLITQPVGSYHCRGDLVRSVDSLTRIAGPSCRLGDFVPYSH